MIKEGEGREGEERSVGMFNSQHDRDLGTTRPAIVS